MHNKQFIKINNSRYIYAFINIFFILLKNDTRDKSNEQQYGARRTRLREHLLPHLKKKKNNKSTNNEKQYQKR